jgi:hypothetical protein
MRTPTQAILGYAELLERYPEKGEEVYTIKKMLRDFKDLLMIY